MLGSLYFHLANMGEARRGLPCVVAIALAPLTGACYGTVIISRDDYLSEEFSGFAVYNGD